MTKETMEERGWRFKCSDGYHDGYWKTVVESPQWLAWVKENQRNMQFDIDECQECGWISQEHFQAFMKFTTLTALKQQRQQIGEEILKEYINNPHEIDEKTMNRILNIPSLRQ